MRGSSHDWKGLDECKNQTTAAAHDRRNEGDTMENPATTTTARPMWFVTSGACVLEDKCLSSPHFPLDYGYGERCQVTITDAWSGFLYVEKFFTNMDYMDSLFVDGVRFRGTQHQKSRLHGVVPESSILWTTDFYGDEERTKGYLGWRICQASWEPTDVRGEGVSAC